MEKMTHDSPVEFRQKRVICGKNLDKDILYTVGKEILCRLRISTGSKFLLWAKFFTAKSLPGGKIEKLHITRKKSVLRSDINRLVYQVKWPTNLALGVS